MHLVLASTSRFRRALLDRLGVTYSAVAPDFEEVAPPEVPADERALRFAEGKARSLAAQFPDALIIGCDQVLELDGEILHKARTLAEAETQLAQLAGRAHRLWTGIAALHPASETAACELACVELRMRSLTPEQIARYVAHDQPIGSAGGYTFEGRGIALFDSVTGGDDSAIVGLPLLSLCQLLRRFGIEPLDAP